jgi:hypothetical protein
VKFSEQKKIIITTFDGFKFQEEKKNRSDEAIYWSSHAATLEKRKSPKQGTHVQLPAQSALEAKENPSAIIPTEFTRRRDS